MLNSAPENFKKINEFSIVTNLDKDNNIDTNINKANIL